MKGLGVDRAALDLPPDVRARVVATATRDALEPQRATFPASL